MESAFLQIIERRGIKYDASAFFISISVECDLRKKMKS